MTFDKTREFHSFSASFTTEESAAPLGISFSTLLQAFSVESHEIPTRELTSELSKEKSPPTRTDPDVDEANPLDCSTLPPASVPLYALLLTG